MYLTSTLSRISKKKSLTCSVQYRNYHLLIYFFSIFRISILIVSIASKDLSECDDFFLFYAKQGQQNLNQDPRQQLFLI